MESDNFGPMETSEPISVVEHLYAVHISVTAVTHALARGAHRDARKMMGRFA
jgi:hypothetical protein